MIDKTSPSFYSYIVDEIAPRNEASFIWGYRKRSCICLPNETVKTQFGEVVIPITQQFSL